MVGQGLSFREKIDNERREPRRIGRDDFNFLSQNILASSQIAPVTERNTLDYMVLVWRVCYTLQKRYPCDRIFPRECKNRFLGFLLLISDLMLAIFTQTSSVTKRNIMDGMNKVLGTAYTPHQCSYSDRKSPFWEKSPNNDNMGVMVIIWCT